MAKQTNNLDSKTNARYGNGMAGYTKLFARILDSTVWRETDPARILWITMLAMANRDGVVESTIPGLADRARISLEDCEAALDKFQQPDKYSWSKEEQGRRIKTVDGGWFLINHSKYRALMSAEDQREKTRLRVERWRGKHVTPRNDNVTLGNDCNDIAEAKAKADTKEIKPKPTHLSKKEFYSLPSLGEVQAYCQERKEEGHPPVNHQQWFDYYTSNGWMVGKTRMKDWRAAVRTWEHHQRRQTDGQKTATQLREERNRETLRRSISQIDDPADQPEPLFKGTN